MPSDSRFLPSTRIEYFGGMIERSTSTTSTFFADPSWSRNQHRLPTVICALLFPSILSRIRKKDKTERQNKRKKRICSFFGRRPTNNVQRHSSVCKLVSGGKNRSNTMKYLTLYAARAHTCSRSRTLAWDLLSYDLFPHLLSSPCTATATTICSAG